MNLKDEIVVITGAGISVESGIKPFRGSTESIWTENPTEIATFHYFNSNPLKFLTWYYQRFVKCQDALPNLAHQILAQQDIKIITQNIDNLHSKAGHNLEKLIEIHGNLRYKRKLNTTMRSALEIASWENINNLSLSLDLTKEFNLNKNNQLSKQSYRPHILLFDEYYTELYQYNLALNWVYKAKLLIFIGTSNSVGITQSILDIGLEYRKKIIVVDPFPSSSFLKNGIEIVKETAIQFSQSFFNTPC